jgi:hypothetical protein
MTSTYNDIRAAIEERIATELAKSPVYPVSYQNIPFTPPNNTPWLQVFLRLGDNSYATLLPTGSAGFNRQNGTLVVNVFTPSALVPLLISPLQSASRIYLIAKPCQASSLMPHLAHRRWCRQRQNRTTRRNLRSRLKRM